MKKQLSVFALHARAAIGRLALVLLGMLALDAAAYALFGLRRVPGFAHGQRAGHGAAGDLFAGAGRLPAAARQLLRRGQPVRLHARRLQIPETRVLLWSGVCNALCFACVWCVQLMASVGTAALHAADARYAEGAQGIFVDFYRSEFLHGLLPLADGYLWVRNVVFVLALGVLTAYHAAGAAAEERRAAAGAGRADRTDAAGAAGRVRLRPDRGDPAKRGGAVRRGIAGNLGFLQAHNGKEGPEDELD